MSLRKVFGILCLLPLASLVTALILMAIYCVIALIWEVHVLLILMLLFAVTILGVYLLDGKKRIK